MFPKLFTLALEDLSKELISDNKVLYIQEHRLNKLKFANLRH